MISTFYGLEKLVAAPTPATFLAALVIGFFFGFALEYAGFGSSRKLSGIFYFRDMTVLRVMFTALITAMLGLSILSRLGWIDLETQVYVLPSIYGAQIVGGLIFRRRLCHERLVPGYRCGRRSLRQTRCFGLPGRRYSGCDHLQRDVWLDGRAADQASVQSPSGSIADCSHCCSRWPR